VGYKKYPPFELIQEGYMRFLKTEHFEEVSPEYLVVDVKKLIFVNNEDDVLEKRQELINFIWGEERFALPDFMPAAIEKNISDDRYSDLIDLESIDKITVNMEYEINSVAYHFHPNKSNNRLIIYHQGHEGDFISGKNTIQFFLNRGYQVMAFAMPLGGMNSKPVVWSNIMGELKLSRHDDLKFLKLGSGSPIKFFVEPIAIVLNYVEEEFDYKDTSMIGISGGGWTTVLYSALDPRISKNYPVAGSLPIFLRDPSFEGGDYEQSLIELYKIANYLDLYIMGSYGEGRSQLQVFNQYDSCCFAGVRYRAYKDEIKNVIFNLGAGSFDVFLDDTHREHKISDAALESIIDDLE